MRKFILLSSVFTWLFFTLAPVEILAGSPQNLPVDTGQTRINAENEGSRAAEDQTPQPEPSPGRRGRLLPIRN